MKRVIIVVSLIFLSGSIFSQPAFRFYQSNMVKVLDQNGKELRNPFGGGLKFPVFTNLDLNFDGKQDLVILDRADDRVLTFLNEGGKDTVKFTYRPEYEDLFPDTLNRYLLFKDYNGDGKADLITYCSYTGGNIEMMKNISFGNKILFERYYPDPADPGNPALISHFYGDSTFSFPIPVKSTDIPCFIDADQDGDLDMFTFDDLGGSYLWYFKNYSVELHGNADSMIFDMADSYWGYFMEGDNTNLVFLGRANPFPWKHYKLMPGNTRHTGSTLLVNDMNNDGDLDLLVGDIGYPGIRYLINGKKERNSRFDSIIDQDTFFPASKPVNIHNMPGTFNIDINNDGVKDFIFTPMDESILSYNLDGLNQIWYYKNSGQNNKPILSYVKDNFLQEDMIDLGGSSAPAFFDYDGDGDLDLFVATKGNLTVSKYSADHVVVYKNIGSTSKPVYKKVDDDYLNIKAKGYKSLSLLFSDINGDGNKDLLMGSLNGHIIYYKNNPVNDSAVFTFVTDYFDSIDVGDYSVPATADLDKDSLPELIIGGKGLNNTGLYYYKNTGTKEKPKFSLITDNFGYTTKNGGDHYYAPVIADMDTNGHTDLILSYNDLDPIVGLITSKVSIFNDIDLKTGQHFTSVDTLFYNIMTGKAVKKYIGRKLRPAVADLDGDNLPDLVFGSDRGGLLFYGTNTSLSTQIKVTGKTLLCQGDSAILDAGPGFDSYLWNTGSKNQTIVVKNAGSYQCTVQKGSFSYTAYMSIQKHSGSVKADFTATNSNLSVAFEILAQNIDSIRWSFGDGTFSNDLNPVHAYNTPGNYNVCVQIWDNCGAYDDTCKTNYYKGIKENQNYQVTIYPNPVKDFVKIKSENAGAGKIYYIRITDILGRQMFLKEYNLDKEITIDLSKFNPGTYILSVIDIKFRISKKKILVKTDQHN